MLVQDLLSMCVNPEQCLAVTAVVEGLVGKVAVGSLTMVVVAAV